MKQPAILLDFVYYGTKAAGMALFDLYYGSLQSVATSRSDNMYALKDLGTLSLSGFAPLLCQRGERKNSYTASLLTYNTSDVKSVWTDYSNFIAAHPEAASSLYLWEAYPTEGVKAVDASTTAYANRDERYIVYVSTLSVESMAC